MLECVPSDLVVPRIVRATLGQGILGGDTDRGVAASFLLQILGVNGDRHQSDATEVHQGLPYLVSVRVADFHFGQIL